MTHLSMNPIPLDKNTNKFLANDELYSTMRKLRGMGIYICIKITVMPLKVVF